MAYSGLMGCYGGGLVLCSAWYVRCNSASFAHLQLMWTTLHPLNLYKNSFYDCVGVKSQNNEIWKSWSWSGNLNKTVVRIRSGLFTMCWIQPDSSPEILILLISALHLRPAVTIISGEMLGVGTPTRGGTGSWAGVDSGRSLRFSLRPGPGPGVKNLGKTEPGSRITFQFRQ